MNGEPVNEDAVKLTSYFGERRRVAGGGFAADALLSLYGQHQIATSILLRGAEGFGAGQRLRRIERIGYRACRVMHVSCIVMIVVAGDAYG